MPTPEQDRKMIEECREAFASLVRAKQAARANQFEISYLRPLECAEDNVTSVLARHSPRLLTLAAQALQTPPVTDESALRKRIKEVVTEFIVAERDGDRREHPADHELINDLCLLLSAPKPVTPEDAKRRAEEDARRIVAAHLKRTTTLALEGDVTTGRYLDLIADITQALLARGGGSSALTAHSQEAKTEEGGA